MEYDFTGLGNRLRIARQQKGLSQKDLSIILKIHQSTYSKIENGNYVNINLSMLVKLSSVLDVPINWFIGTNSIADLTDKECLEVEKFINYIISLRKM